MSFRNYFDSLNAQTGLKAYIKKRLFSNLLKELVKQEKEIEKQKGILKEQEKALRELKVLLDKRNIDTASSKQNESIPESVLLRENPGILIDVTVLSRRDIGTGIQRVVNNLFHQLYHLPGIGNIVAVRNKSGKMLTSYSYVARREGVPEKMDQTIVFQRGDKLFLLDHPWGEYTDFSHFLELAAETNIPSYAIIHDMIPVQYPELCNSSAVIENFVNWHNMILQKADAVICVSRATADAVARYYGQMEFKRKKALSLYYFHLGADVPGGEQSVRDEIRNFVKKGKTFLMVGTLEPRKGHSVVLQALQKLSNEVRGMCQILIIGHNGWKNEDISKMLALPEFRRKALWIQDATDAELRWAYAHTDALIAASLQEGFGLPLVEASYFGLPIICSDIPVFREVTQGYADFFKAMDPDALSKCLTKWIRAERHPDSHNIRIYSWQESAKEISDIMERKTKPYKILL